MAQKPKAAVIPLFRNEPVAEEVAVGRPLHGPASEPSVVPPVAAVDLGERAKVLMVIGSGNVGKTTLLRWLVETMLGRDGQAVIAAVDPENRSLADYFAGVYEPPSFVPAAVAKWLEGFLGFAMERQASAAIDFGGGDTSLGQLVATTPNLVETMEAAGVSPVAIYVVSPRLDDLSPLATFEKGGFRPRATAIVLNEGLADPTKPREQSFGPILRHSVYRDAVARGAVTVWMPRLIPAAEVELRRIQFAQAADGIIPEGRKLTPLGPFDRARVRQWLGAMATEFQPIASWIP